MENLVFCFEAPLLRHQSLSGDGAHGDATIQIYWKLSGFSVQVLRQFPLVGMPQRRGHACMPPRASEFLNGFSKYIFLTKRILVKKKHPVGFSAYSSHVVSRNATGGF